MSEGTGMASLVGRVGVWGHLDSLRMGDLRSYGRRVEELGFGALWVPETVGREPFALLALLAGGTSRLVLGTSIASIYARDAVTTRAAAMTLHEATGGRFILGLGVSHPHLVTKVRGHEYAAPVTAMRDYLAAYRTALYRGPLVEGDAGAAEPRVLVAALRPRMTALAAVDADGAFPYLVRPERLAEMRGWLDAAASGGQRPMLAVTLPVVVAAEASTAREVARGYLAPYLRTPTYQESWREQGFGEEDWERPGSDRLVDAMIAWGGAAALKARIASLHEAGADHVALIPLAPDATTEHLPALEALAG